MQALTERFNYLFRSTRGLVLVAIALIALVTVIWGMLSGPMAELGVRDAVIRLFNMKIFDADREARIIILYHTIAMAVVAIEVYLIGASVPMKKSDQAGLNALATAGYLFSLVFGLAFAYFGRNFVFHGLFIFGQSLMFFCGLKLAWVLWPWKKEYRQTDSSYARTRGGVDLERVAFFAMSVATLGSVLFGAIPGSLFGNGFEYFLAENVVRAPEKTSLDLAVIGHLHIMLTLIAVALLLLVGRWLDFKGILHKISMPVVTTGAVVVTLGVWLVVPFETAAHTVIYVGSAFLLLPALFLAIYGWRKLIRDRLLELGLKTAGTGRRLVALLHDPLKFGALWQMMYMNVIVTFVGIFMALRLDKVIRTWPAREERVILTGHWHILAGIIATIILLYFADLSGLKGRIRLWFGWVIIIFSDLAFTAVTLFETKRLYVTETGQQGLVDTTMVLADLGLAMVLVTLAAFLVWRLLDLFRRKGRWKDELTGDNPAGTEGK
jgi:hypothetical protein